MTKPLYKSLYVIAGQREDGTYGIMRNTPSDTVDCFDTPQGALCNMRERDPFLQFVAIDIGLLVNSNIKKKGDVIEIDFSGRLKRRR